MVQGQISQRALLEIITKGFQRTEAEIDSLRKEMLLLGQATTKSGAAIGGMEKQVRKSRDSVSAFATASGSLYDRMKSLITGGMLMSIGWQAINTVLTTTVSAFNDLVMGGIELETAMVSLEAVAGSTGRSFGDVMSILTSETDALMTKTALAPGVLRLLSTELDTAQIKKFIQAVKDGSAAMGYQADEQLPLIARGFKQLTANILDNIGVTIYLTRLRRRASKELEISQDALTEAQIHQALYSEMIEQTAKYTGLYEKSMETATGAMARMNTEWIKLTESVGNTEAIKDASNAVADLIGDVNMVMLALQDKAREDEKNAAITEMIVQEMSYESDALKRVREEQKKAREEIDKSIQQLKEDIKYRAERALYYEQWIALEKEYNVIQKYVNKEMEIGVYFAQDYADTFDMLIAKGKDMTEVMEEITEATKKQKKAFTEDIYEMRLMKDLHKDYEKDQLELGKTMKDLEDAIEGDTKALRKSRIYMREVRYELTEVNDELSDMQDKLRSLESKRKIIDPDAFRETEDALRDVRRELKSVEREVEKTREQLFKRVEPRLFQEYMRQHEEAKKEKIKLKDEEEKLTSKVMKEIAELEKQTRASVELVVTQEKLRDIIKEVRGYMDNLTDSVANNREELSDAKKELEPLKEDLEIVSKAIKDAYNNWEAWLKSPDKLTKTVRLIYEERYRATPKPLVDPYAYGSEVSPWGRQKGAGFIPKTGLYQLHKGEAVMTAREVRETNTFSYNFEAGAFAFSAGVDARQIYSQMEREARLRSARAMQ